MRALLSIVLVLAMGNAIAQYSTSYRFDGGVVSIGQGAARLIEKAGRQPDRIVNIENSRGAVVGERWEYHLRGRQVNVVLVGGKIQRIEELR